MRRTLYSTSSGTTVRSWIYVTMPSRRTRISRSRQCFCSCRSTCPHHLSRYLHATVHTGFVLLRLLEAWGKTKGEMYVQRKRGKKKKKRKAQGNDNGKSHAHRMLEVVLTQIA